MSVLHSSIRALAVVSLLATASASLSAQTPNAVKLPENATPAAPTVTNSPNTSQSLAKVNGVSLPLTHAELLLREQLAKGAANSPQLQAAVRETLITQAVLAEEARKQGLEQLPLVAAKMEVASQSALVQSWQQAFIQTLKIEETQLKAEYDRQTQTLGDTEYLLRHVLVAEEAMAKLLLEKVKGGARLADLTQEYSRDPQTKDRGGLSDWTGMGQLAPTIREALKGLRKAELAAKPVQTPIGWHVLQLEDQRAYQAPAMDTVRQQLVQAIVQQRLQQKIAELRKNVKVE